MKIEHLISVVVVLAILAGISLVLSYIFKIEMILVFGVLVGLMIAVQVLGVGLFQLFKFFSKK
jgi:hypothetical protein